MDSLLSDWCAFCEGKAIFDKSDFLGLLNSYNSTDELRKIFKYFPFSEELEHRAEQVFASGDCASSLYLLPKIRGSQEEIVRLGKQWLNELERVCGLLGDTELIDTCHNAEVTFVDNRVVREALQLDIPHRWMFADIGDAIRDSRISYTAQTYALFEALYGVAADYRLAWYMARPLFEFEINLEPYFNFWRVSGDCALTHDKFLVSN